MRKILTLIVGLSLSAVLFAQSLDAGKQMYLKGEYANAKPIFEKYIKQRPNDASLNHWLGVCYYETGEKNRAEKFLRLGAKRNIQESYRYLAQLLIEEYRFDDAVDAMDTYLAFRKLTDEQKVIGELLLQKAEMGQRHMDGIDDIVVVDSISIDKAQFLNAIKLGSEAGSLTPFTTFFNGDSNIESSVYMNEMKNKIFFADMTDSMQLDIFTSSVSDGEFKEKQSISDQINSKYNETHPFMLSDGMTLYFASDRPESLGGYDIYMSSYNLGNEDYLKADNIGFPYNSPANDYMLAVDELNGIGWLVSDRYQSEGMVCIYVFIYNDRRNNLNCEDTNKRADFARLSSFKNSWKEGEDYHDVLLKIKELSQGSGKKEKTFVFVVNDNQVINNLNEFRNSQARELFKQLQTMYKGLDENRLSLEDLRYQYFSKSDAAKKVLQPKILGLEGEIQRAEKQIEDIEIKIRNLENQ
ncbi:MAG: tetratricopeptide repeat protein [Bacteroidales bacterium]